VGLAKREGEKHQEGKIRHGGERSSGLQRSECSNGLREGKKKIGKEQNTTRLEGRERKKGRHSELLQLERAGNGSALSIISYMPIEREQLIPPRAPRNRIGTGYDLSIISNQTG